MINKKGFTIIEILVSVGIFSLAIVSIVSIFNFLNRSNFSLDNRYLANNLASEGIEISTYIRDNNFLNNRSYLTGLNSGSDETFIILFDNLNKNYIFDFGPNNENINSCSTSLNNSCRVYKSDLYDTYTQSRNNVNTDLKPTNFYRLIRAQRFTGRLKIISTVLWKENNQNNIITLEKDLWDWK